MTAGGGGDDDGSGGEEERADEAEYNSFMAERRPRGDAPRAARAKRKAAGGTPRWARRAAAAAAAVQTAEAAREAQAELRQPRLSKGEEEGRRLAAAAAADAPVAAQEAAAEAEAAEHAEAARALLYRGQRRRLYALNAGRPTTRVPPAHRPRRRRRRLEGRGAAGDRSPEAARGVRDARAS